MKIKKTEQIVLTTLEENPRAREDDFILYGGVLKRLGVSLSTPLNSFLATAKLNKYPSFETVSRCRRHIQELRQDLVNSQVAIKREDRQEDFKNYNLSGIGEKYE